MRLNFLKQSTRSYQMKLIKLSRVPVKNVQLMRMRRNLTRTLHSEDIQ